ncbi:hypothetical protein Q5762_12245 [Streptomyces sp. P9(2023)]|uniref:hypothetical protein n=1 Tax=Streptomyces sp. P9(2023) TaxID=3064394 RepID=UPI0028F41CA2|nr:hypothetical protein [Streptomyces sp. P9(2023)]MDT9689098.1 hypothetical protein [Streptomyces sp. P9(2023)]
MHTLAAELAATPGDHSATFRRYESVHRTRVGPKQRHVRRAASLLVPATRPGLTTRNLGARAWTAATAVRDGRRQGPDGAAGMS